MLFVAEDQEAKSSLEYRRAINAQGSPSETVSATYTWMPGTELMRDAPSEATQV